MRNALLALLLLCLALFAASDKTTARADGKPAAVCEPQSHQHRTRDMRAAAVEIRDADSCGISFVDLEAQLVGRYALAKDFRVVEIGNDGRTVVRPASELKKGKRGTLVYCEHCRAAVGFRIEE